jgi:transcriptional regulator with XRE-family HTH domain
MDTCVYSFAQRLKELREENGQTQETVASALGLARQSVSFYEAAQRTPDVATLAKVARYFGVSPSYLLGFTSFKNEAHSNNESLGLGYEAVERIRSLPNPATSILDSLLASENFHEFILFTTLSSIYFAFIKRGSIDAWSAHSMYKTEAISILTEVVEELTSPNIIPAAIAQKTDAILANAQTKIMARMASELYDRASHFNHALNSYGLSDEDMKAQHAIINELNKLYEKIDIFNDLLLNDEEPNDE